MGHANKDVFFQKNRGTPPTGVLSSGVRIKKEHRFLGIPTDQPCLVRRQRRPERGHRRGRAGLVKTDHVHIPFNNNGLAAVPQIGPPLIKTVEVTTLCVNRSVRGVNVFRPRVFPQHTSTKSNNLTIRVVDGKDQPPTQRILIPPRAFGPGSETGLKQNFNGHAFLERRIQKSVPPR